MATLERIRQRSGFLLIVIGLAMLAFILTDLFSSGNSMFRGDINIVGEVNGVEIDVREFTQRMDQRQTLLQRQNPQQFSGISRTVLADQMWREFQEEVLLESNYDNLGLAVNNEELFRRITSNPQVRSQAGFQDQVTGQFSPAAVRNYISQIKQNVNNDPQAAAAYEQWINFENGTREDALRNKYLYAVRKGIYMPTSLAQADYKRRNELTTLQYIGLEFNSIADSTISVEESDLKRYYSEHKSEYTSEESKSIAFVSFNVEASQGDRNALKDELKSYLSEQVINTRGKVDTLPSFYNTENDSTYAVGRSDLPVQGSYFTKEELGEPLDSILMEKEVGYIHGPYEENSTYVLAKISDIINKPDSVKARHILISYQGAANGQSQATRAPQEAKVLADSLLAIVKEDSTQFGAIAQANSDDPGSGAKGGALGWFKPGAMVPEFNDFCFYKEKGTIGMAYSQFGIHIIHIQDQMGANKAIKLTKIARVIEASDATRDSIYDLASNFAAKANDTTDFATSAINNGYNPRPAAEITPMQESILGIGNNREIVRWMYNEETELGDIQLFNQDNNAFVVVQVTGAAPEGIAPLEDVKDDVRDAVIAEKKAAQLTKRMEEAMAANGEIEAVAGALSLSVKNQGMNFATSNLQGYGSEPVVIGRASSLEIGQTAGPIVGDRGVYLIKVSARNPAAELQSYESEQIRIETNIANEAPTKVLESLKNSAKVVDNRRKFF